MDRKLHELAPCKGGGRTDRVPVRRRRTVRRRSGYRRGADGNGEWNFSVSRAISLSDSWPKRAVGAVCGRNIGADAVTRGFRLIFEVERVYNCLCKPRKVAPIVGVLSQYPPSVRGMAQGHSINIGEVCHDHVSTG